MILEPKPPPRKDLEPRFRCDGKFFPLGNRVEIFTPPISTGITGARTHIRMIGDDTKLKLSCPHVSSACNHQPKPVKRANRSGALRKACNTSLNAVSNAALVSKTRLDKAPRKTSNQRSTGFS